MRASVIGADMFLDVLLDMSGFKPAPTPLLGDSEPSPVEVVNALGRADYVLVCEHAGRAVPAKLDRLGLSPGELDRHIGWDIGAEAVARGLSRSLDAPLVLQRYSRLVIDCNRPFHAPDSIPAVSDGTVVPANSGINDEARQERWRVIHQPFHERIASLIDDRLGAGRAVRLVAVHSFTPRMRTSGGDRPWLLGLLHGPDARLARALADALGPETAKAINLTFNAPYIVDHISDYTLPVHGERLALPNILLEIRQDQIADAQGQQRWIKLLSDAFLRITDEMLQRGAQ
jgi:predicted N-formylglutamate amidohydrolase